MTDQSLTRPLNDDHGALGGRNETPLERWDRNLIELLQEVRVVQTGVQVLFAFLLTAPLATGFPDITGFQRGVYFTALIASGGAAVLLIAPTAHHRIMFRCGDKEHLVKMANRYTLAGLAALAIAMIGALMFTTDLLFSSEAAVAIAVVTTVVLVWCWAVSPLRRRRRIAARP